MHRSKFERYMIIAMLSCTSTLTALLCVPLGIREGKSIAIKEHKLAVVNNELDTINNHKTKFKVLEDTLEGNDAKLKIHINDLGDISFSFDITDIAGTLTADIIEPCEPTAPYGSELQEKNYQAILRRKQLKQQVIKEQSADKHKGE